MSLPRKITTVDLLSTALKASQLSGLRIVLRQLAESFRADGCILWEAAPAEDQGAADGLGNLFTQAHWLPDDRAYAIRGLPIDRSVTGHAIRTGKVQYVRDIEKDERVYTETVFWNAFHFRSFCSAPASFPPRNIGALNLYSKKKDGFPAKVISDLPKMARALPHLYQTLQSQVSFTLISRIDKIIHEADTESAGEALSKEKIVQTLDKICKCVQDTFQCFETSIILEDSIGRPKVYELLATTWPIDCQNGSMKRAYDASANEGLTGWILANDKPVAIADLADFDPSVESIQRRYPGMCWLDTGDIRTAFQKFSGSEVKPEHESQPLSFMGSPINVGSRIYGVIRCCTSIKGPYYFGQRELEILDLVATRIGQAWNNWLQRRTIHDENKAWQRFVERMSSINLVVSKELESSGPKQESIFKEVLSFAAEAIPQAAGLSVQLIDKKRRELFYAHTAGVAWETLVDDLKSPNKSSRFPTYGEKAVSLGAQVFHQKELVHRSLTDIEASALGDIFPQTTEAISAPLIVGTDILGILTIQSTSGSLFPRTIVPITRLLGLQLAVYYHLAATISQVRMFQDQQVQTFKDFVHQLRSPLALAVIRSRRLHKHLSDDIRRGNQKNLQAIAGLCSKANRVAKNIRLFSDLAQSQLIQAKPTNIGGDRIFKILIEAASDNEWMIDPKREIFIDVDRSMMGMLTSAPLKLDVLLFEQAVNNLLDNAVKYSFDKSRIIMSAEPDQGGSLSILFKNRGIPILPNEPSLCIRRGWRGELATAVTGEGEGIGLWIVDNIMEAHKGQLSIIPTDADGWTQIKLKFPWGKEMP